MIWRKQANLWRTITRPDVGPVLNKRAPSDHNPLAYLPYQAGRSRHSVKVKNRGHPAMERVMDVFGLKRRSDVQSRPLSDIEQPCRKDGS
jgi:hypothetical protein